MTKEPTSIDFRCSNCDHPLVTLPLDYHFSGPLICPGCGETFELPESVEDLLKERRKTEKKKEPGESSD